MNRYIIGTAVGGFLGVAAAMTLHDFVTRPRPQPQAQCFHSITLRSTFQQAATAREYGCIK